MWDMVIFVDLSPSVERMWDMVIFVWFLLSFFLINLLLLRVCETLCFSCGFYYHFSWFISFCWLSFISPSVERMWDGDLRWFISFCWSYVIVYLCLQRMLPFESCTDLLFYPCPEIPQSVMYTIRPYTSQDRVGAYCSTTTCALVYYLNHLITSVAATKLSSKYHTKVSRNFWH